MDEGACVQEFKAADCVDQDGTMLATAGPVCPIGKEWTEALASSEKFPRGLTDGREFGAYGTKSDALAVDHGGESARDLVPKLHRHRLPPLHRDRPLGRVGSMGKGLHMGRSEYVAKWVALHGDVEPSRIVAGWLSFAFVSARLLRPISANAISLLTIVIGGVGAWLAPSRYVAFIVIAALILDGLDGTVAILRNEVTLRGAVLDSVADRLVEVAWLIALWRCDVPLWVVAGIWVVGFVQEYSRAKIRSLGIYEVGVVTIAERPVRGLLIAAGIGLPFLATPLAVLLLIMELYALRQVAEYAYRVLRNPGAN